MFVKHQRFILPKHKSSKILLQFGIPGRYAALISHSFGAKRFDHGTNFAVLEKRASVLISVLDGNIHHCPRQIVSANHLVGKYQPKHWVDGAQ
jgi:hypothetical protein